MKVLLIPSATLIPKEMRNKLGEIPTILYPLNNTPLIDHLYQQYRDFVDEIYVVAYKKKELVIDYIQIKNLHINVISLDDLKDIGYTVMKGLEEIPNFKDLTDIYINFADTLVFDSLKIDRDCCFFGTSFLKDTWTYFEKDDENRILRIIDKQEPEAGKDLEEMPFFVGCFHLTAVQSFKSCLQKALQKPSTCCDSFYRALQEYTQTNNNMQYVAAQEWFDVGHAENYLKAKTGVQARVFNAIEIDEARGILKKTSVNTDKFINEIKWYLKLPNKLQYLVPRIYDYSISRENPYIAMECYGYHTLHEIFLFGNLPLYRWQNVFERLRFIIDDMERYTVRDASGLGEAMRDMYISKTLARLNTLKTSPQFSGFFKNSIEINGHIYRSLTEYMELLPKVIHKVLLQNSHDEFTIIHGDLCFSNILLEENYGFMRIIDPRGEFGGFDIYGDPRYEMAKLLHSIEGKYDFIIEDMFHIEVTENRISFSMQKDTEALLSLFKEVFRHKLKRYMEIKLIESTLFLSMIPLHSDFLSRQYAMLATGVIQLEEVLKEYDYE